MGNWRKNTEPETPRWGEGELTPGKKEALLERDHGRGEKRGRTKKGVRGDP